MSARGDSKESNDLIQSMYIKTCQLISKAATFSVLMLVLSVFLFFHGAYASDIVFTESGFLDLRDSHLHIHLIVGAYCFLMFMMMTLSLLTINAFLPSIIAFRNQPNHAGIEGNQKGPGHLPIDCG